VPGITHTVWIVISVGLAVSIGVSLWVTNKLKQQIACLAWLAFAVILTIFLDRTLLHIAPDFWAGMISVITFLLNFAVFLKDDLPPDPMFRLYEEEAPAPRPIIKGRLERLRDDDLVV